MSYALGIDFGTTFSAAVVQRTGNTHVVTLGNRSGAVPSVLLVRPDATLLFGEEAALRGVGEPGRLLANLKRRLGDPGPVVVEHHAFRADELVGEYIRWIVDRVREREGGPADVIAIGYPANWGAHRREAFHAALAYVGLEGSALVTEPHAAALFHAGAHEVGPGERLAVYDLGGGTFDAAVLRRTGDGFELVGDPEGVEHLGGLDFDEALLHLVRARSAEAWAAAQRQGGSGSVAAAAALRRECVAAKEILSAEPRVSVPILLPGVAPIEIERSAFEVMIRPAIEESLGAFRRALRSAAVTPADLAAVLLVGGSSRIPLVRNLVNAEVAGTMLLDSDPRYAVARGVAAFAAQATAHDREGVARQPVTAGMATTLAPTPRLPGGPDPDHADQHGVRRAEDEDSAPSTNGFLRMADGNGNGNAGAGDASGSAAVDVRPLRDEAAPAEVPGVEMRGAEMPRSQGAGGPLAEGDEAAGPNAEPVELHDTGPGPWATAPVSEPFVMLSRRDRKRQARANRRRRSRVRALLAVLILVIVAVAVLVVARSAAGSTLTGQRDRTASRAPAAARPLERPSA